MNRSFSYFSLQAPVKERGQPNIEVGFQRDPDGLSLEYIVRGELNAFVLPGRDPKPGAELWQNTCFELFARLPGHEDYWEWNFSPEGRFNVYYFTQYRKREEGVVSVGTWPPRISFSEEASVWRCNVRLNLSTSPSLNWAWSSGAALEVSPAVILKTKDGSFQYWAQTHPGPKPDFHDARNFINSI